MCPLGLPTTAGRPLALSKYQASHALSGGLSCFLAITRRLHVSAIRTISSARLEVVGPATTSKRSQDRPLGFSIQEPTLT